jgi:hypothetical protein
MAYSFAHSGPLGSEVPQQDTPPFFISREHEFRRVGKKSFDVGVVETGFGAKLMGCLLYATIKAGICLIHGNLWVIDDDGC